jgi:CheY-like chemotaxis protein/CHASE3 domain sensor protein
MRVSIGLKIAIGFGLALLALLAIGFVTSLDLKELTDDTGWVTHTLEVEQQIDKIRSGLLRAVASVRGNELSPQPDFQKTFQVANGETRGAFSRVRFLTQDNASQQERLTELEPMLNHRLGALEQLLDAPANDAAQRAKLVDEGEAEMADIRNLLDKMEEEERRLLALRQARSNGMEQLTSDTIIFGTLGAFVLTALAAALVTRSITGPLGALRYSAGVIGGGDYTHRATILSQDEVGQMAAVFNVMAEQVQRRQDSLAEQDLLKQNLARFSALFQGQREVAPLGRGVLGELAELIGARHAVLYVAQADGKSIVLKMEAAYAFDQPPLTLQPGESLVGQAYVDRKRIILADVPPGYLRIHSALGETKPATVVIQPVIFDTEVKAVLELALATPPRETQLTLLEQVAHNLGIVLNTIAASMRTEELLRQTRHSEQLLQMQQEELQQNNEEMEQTNEELQQTNEEMEEKVNLLAEQKRQLEAAKVQIEFARDELEKRAQQIAQGSRYKSEFLANMSHELRTPLNSLLILSKMLADNPQANLNEKQVKYARTIYASGNDLLELINEILDLAKIESGSATFESQPVTFNELREFMDQNFRHIAEGKNLSLNLSFADSLPDKMITDPRRLQQILKNLLSNAFKFTEQGSVSVNVSLASGPRSIVVPDNAGPIVAFAVVDTGPGIPGDKHELIFGAFQQADAGTARKYGGTGLGLSISRELAALLGGTLELSESSPAGSTFTLYLPVERPLEGNTGAPVLEASPSPKTTPESPRASSARAPSGEPFDDDRDSIRTGDMVLLIIEDDKAFSGIMRDFAREKNFKAVIARSAAEGVALARELRPSAITLDLHLPDNDGWVVLDRLKHDPLTRHVPIHVVSVDPERERSLRLGAISYLQKPVSRESLEDALSQTISFINRPLKNLLIIEDDAVQRQGLKDLIGTGDVQTTAVGSAHEALLALEQTRFDCVVLDLGLPDTSGPDLIRAIHQKTGENAPPIIVYTGKDLSRAEETELRMISDSIVIKSVRSPDRLLDETALFLHRVQSQLPETQQRIIEKVQKSDSLLSGRHVLIVDDDVRNIFALTSALEASDMKVSYAESGQAAIDLLQAKPDIEVVLMDVMMPGMDGFETTRRLRQIEKFRKLPIISVTAKALKDDREKCLQAGASDYITKPVDLDQLRSLLRVWLYR